MPAPFGPTIPIRSPRWAARNGARATRVGSVAGVAVGGKRAAARQVADREVLDPDDDLAGPRRAAAASAARRAVAACAPAFGASTRSAWSRSSRASCSCIFAYLRWLR